MTPEFQSSINKTQNIVRRLFILIGLVFLCHAPAQALEFQCEKDGDVRHIRVDIPGKKYLCEVNVQYIKKNSEKIVWHASSDTLFCSAKSYELEAKYENEWGFNCVQWPDRDGIDKLSPTNRIILDKQLKKLIEEGKSATTPFSVTNVKATSSALLDDQSGTLALQYFLSNGSDRTDVIINEHDEDWSLMTTIDDLSQYVTGDAPVDTALISSITDSGALEVITDIASEDPLLSCQGIQVLLTSQNETPLARTPHRVICSAKVKSSATQLPTASEEVAQQ